MNRGKSKKVIVIQMNGYVSDEKLCEQYETFREQVDVGILLIPPNFTYKETIEIENESDIWFTKEVKDNGII